MPLVDDALVRIGRAIGKPPGWERVVRALAPPSRFVGGTPRQTPMPDGYVFPIDPGTLIGWHVRFFGSYEPEVRAQIKRWLSPGACAVDVGANVGWHALLMATLVGPAGRVFAFEPNDSTRDRLNAGIQVNDLEQVVVDPRALSDRIGTTGFAAPKAGELWDGTGHMTSAAIDGHASGGSVQCVTLDAFVAERNLERLDFMKIDVEGWELSVLRGASHTLVTLAPTIVFEYDPAYVERCGGSVADLNAFLNAARYQLFMLDARRPPAPIARLEDVGGNVLAVPPRRMSEV
jgi:FkbM family methyltransferase